jgi:phosphohistidine phosphatase
MLELLLLRHAKSTRDGSPDEDDHARDLTRRGTAAAARMGRLLREADAVPDLALCSTATRARRTWELAAAELGREVPVRHLRTLYLAPPSRLLETVRRQEADVGRLLLVGHNPGLHGLAMALSREGEPDLLAALRSAFPTAALARIGFDAVGWADVGAGTGRLLGYWRPRDAG